MPIWWDYIKAVVLIAAIIAAAYYVTKLVAAKSSGFATRSGEIKLLASRSFGRDKHIVVTEVGGKVYVLGMTNQSITLIDTLSPDDFSTGEPAAAPQRTESFAKEFLSRLRGEHTP